MRKNLMNKFTLRILSLFIAIFIWLLVVNIEDPVRTITITDVPVTFANESYIESMNKVALMEDGKDTVDVKVTGASSIMKKISRDNISAVADLTQIVDLESDPIMVPVYVSYSGIEEHNIEARPRNIPITIENRVSQEYTIAVNTGDTKPEKGYEVGKTETNPDRVTIIGPESIMNKIGTVVAQVDVSGMSKDDTRQSEIKVYDKNLEELSEKQMSYLKFDIQSTTIDVNVELWKVKQDVPVEVKYSGTVKAGYYVFQVSSTPNTISIAGTQEALKQFEEDGDKLVIPASLVNISGKSSDYEVKVNLEDLLPEDIELATDISETALVTVKILPLNSKEYEIPVNSITVNNKPSDTDLVFDREKITVRILGTEEALENLKEAQIALSIDLKSYSVGEYEVPVQITLPDGYTSLDTVKVKLKLVKAAEITTG